MAKPKKQCTAKGTVMNALEDTHFTLRNDPRKVDHVVGSKCTENAGSWVCVTHGEQFANQLQKDVHIGTGTHALAWWCFKHGPEVP